MTYTTHRGELTATKQHVEWTVISDAYAGAYLGVFGREIRLGPLAILLAHSALETGRWKAGLWNWNLGNIKASQAYCDKPGNYHQYYRLNELLKQPDGSYKYVWFDPPHPQTRMRAYLSATEGAGEKVRFLMTASNPAKGNRYQKAADAIEADDPIGFSKELKAAGYYTANEGPYTAGVVSLYKEFRAKLDEHPPLVIPAITAPLDPDDYDQDVPLHSGPTEGDFDKWLGDPTWGLSDELHRELEELRKDHNLAQYDRWS